MIKLINCIKPIGCFKLYTVFLYNNISIRKNSRLNSFLNSNSLIGKSSGKVRFSHFYFKYEGFTSTEFISILMKNLLPFNTYSVLVKIKFSSSSLIYTLTRQYGIRVSDFHKQSYYSELFDIYENRIFELLDEYGVDQNPDLVLLELKQHNVDPLLLDSKIKQNTELLNSKVLSNRILPKTSIKRFFNSSYLPLSRKAVLGFLYEGNVKDVLLGKVISVIMDNNCLTGSLLLLQLLKNIEYISNTRIYNKLSANKKLNCVILETSFSNLRAISLSDLELEFLLLKKPKSILFEKNGRVIIVFSLNSGVLLSHVIDVFDDENS